MVRNKEFSYVETTSGSYFSLSNQDGKKWTFPKSDVKTALEIYEPTGKKGILLKQWLPAVYKLPFVKRYLAMTDCDFELSAELRDLIFQTIGGAFEISVFWGTPCVDQKMTMQIFRNREIVGYLKICESDRVLKLCSHEKEILDYLNDNEVSRIPKCYFLKELSSGNYAYFQSTSKRGHEVSPVSFGEMHKDFLDNLYAKSANELVFENTSYYSSQERLRTNLTLLPTEFQASVAENLCDCMNRYAGRTVRWGVVHRDFTPWNTYVVNNQIYAFDFEYAHENAPKYLDRWHFKIQSLIYIHRMSAEEIAGKLSTAAIPERGEIQEYLLDIISLYLERGSGSDIEIASNYAAILIGMRKQQRREQG